MRKFCGIVSLLIVPLFCAMVLVGCKPGTPSKYLSSSEMEDVLYDYHLAMGMLTAQNFDSKENGYQFELYKLAVLKKHGVSEQKFDESMVYYMRHTDQLQEIYKSLTERLQNEASKAGVSVADFGEEGGLAGDTANVWPLAPNALLMQKIPYHQISFVIPADTSFHHGDKFSLRFQTCFLYREGFKDGVAMLALRFANDSVASRSIRFTTDSRYDVSLEDNERLGIKEIRGFIYLDREHNVVPDNSLKALILNQIQLLRVHREKPPVVENVNSVRVADSVRVDSPKKVRNVNDTSSSSPRRVFLGNRLPQVSK